MAVLDSQRINPLVAAILGILIAVAVTASMTVSTKWTAFGVIGIAATVPALLFRPARMYGLAAYLILLVIEPNGKNIDKYFHEVTDYAVIYGIPPSLESTIVLWPSDVALLVLIAFWLLRMVFGHQDAFVPRAGYLLLGFIGWAVFVSLARSGVFFFSLAELIQYCIFFLVFLYAANNLDSMRLIKLVIYVLIGCLFLEAVVVLVAFTFQISGHPMSFLFGSGLSSTFVENFENTSEISTSGEWGNRAVGTFGNFLWVAFFFEFMIPIALALFLIEKHIWKKVLYGCLLTVGAGAHLVTFSRMGLISLAFGCGLCVLLLNSRKLIGLRLMTLILYTGAISSIALTPYVYDYFTTRPENVSRRIPLMEKAVDMILDKPILGVGLNNHTAAKMEMFLPSEEGEETQPVHNYYLSLASDVGLPGFFLQMGVFFLFLRVCWRRPGVDDPLVQGLLIGIFSGIAAFYLHLVGDPFSGHGPRSLFFFLAGLAVALQRLRPESAQPRAAAGSDPDRVQPAPPPGGRHQRPGRSSPAP